MGDKIKLPPLPEPEIDIDGDVHYLRSVLRARDLEVARVVLEAAANLEWVGIMREGQLVTWGDAGTLGFRVVEAILNLEVTHAE